MREKGDWIGLAFVVLLLAGNVPVQGQQYSLNFSKTSSRMTWKPTLPSWNYSVPVRLSAAGDSTSKLRLATSASMNFILDQRSDTWKETASVNTSVSYPILGPKATIGIGANMSVNNAALTKQKIRNQTFNFRFQYSPLQEGKFKSLRVNVTPGLITASRANRADLSSTLEERGIQYNASMRVSPDVKLADKKLSNSFSLSKTDNTLKSNKNRSESFNTNLGYTFFEGVRTNLTLSESRSQRGVTWSKVDEEEVDGEVVRDTLVAVDTQDTRNTSVSSSLNFKLGRFDLKTSSAYRENVRTNTASSVENAGNRWFASNRESNSWSFDSSISGKLTNELVGNSSVSFDASDARFLPVRLSSGGLFRDPSSDLEERDLVVKGSLDWQLAEKHSLRLSSRVQIQRKENPGATEQNRDTYRNTSSLSYEGSMKSGLKLSVRLDNTFSHQVNLHVTRSSDNSRNRDLGLKFDTRYERLGISFSHNFSISAKRTIYDFDRQISPEETERRSNIRRGWSMAHSLRRKFFDHIQLNTRYTYTADDFGKLITESQAQIVEEDRGDHKVSFGMSYSPSTLLSTSVNYSYSFDRRWQHEYENFQEARVLGSRRKSRNLSLSLNYNPSNVTKLSLRGSRSRQRSGTFDSFSVSYSRTI
jgi:hypothetical protein